MKNPIVEVCKGTAAVGDQSGTSILVFQKDGLKGEIKTTSPIQKLVVSEQGIVGVVLKGESTQQIICYDAKGNILVGAEHFTLQILDIRWILPFPIMEKHFLFTYLSYKRLA